jgi:hypothetical protein
MAAMLAAGTQFVYAGGDAPAPAAKPAAKPAAQPAGGPRAFAVDAATMTATVTAIDADKRTVTLEMDGKSKTITCGPEVRNFAQIKVGDLVKTTFVEAMAVFIQKDGGPASGDGLATVTLAPKGARPGVLMTKTVAINVKIDAIDAKNRSVTVTTPEGVTRTFKVDKSVKGLKNLKQGDDVVVKFTEALAIVVEAPK